MPPDLRNSINLPSFPEATRGGPRRTRSAQFHQSTLVSQTQITPPSSPARSAIKKLQPFTPSTYAPSTRNTAPIYNRGCFRWPRESSLSRLEGGIDVECEVCFAIVWSGEACLANTEASFGLHRNWLLEVPVGEAATHQEVEEERAAEDGGDDADGCLLREEHAGDDVAYAEERPAGEERHGHEQPVA